VICWKWGCLLFLFFLGILFYPINVLEVRDDRNERVLFLRRVFPGEGFEFQYIHSVDKTPVIGFFLITPAQTLKPIETQFESYGPGLPSTERGVTVEGRKIKVKTDTIEMERFSFFVSPMTKQSIVLKGERFDFSSSKEGEVITLKVRFCPLLREVLLRHGNR